MHGDGAGTGEEGLDSWRFSRRLLGLLSLGLEDVEHVDGSCRRLAVAEGPTASTTGTGDFCSSSSGCEVEELTLATLCR